MNPKERLKQLIAQYGVCAKDMSAYFDKAKSETDTAKASDIMAAYRAKSEEAKSLNEQIESLKVVVETTDRAEALAKSMEPSIEGKSLTQGNAPARVETVNDPQREQAKHEIAFYDRIGGKSLKPEDEDLLRPRDARFLQSDPSCIMLPKSLARSIQGRPHGKTMLISDTTGGVTDSGGGLTIAPDFRSELLSQPVFIPGIIDRVKKIPGVKGNISWPMLDQGQGKFGGVAFNWKATDGEDKGETEPVFKQIEILTNEVSGWTQLSRAMLRQSVLNLPSIVNDLFSQAFRDLVSEIIITGNGTNRPSGILKAGTAYQLVHREEADKVGYKDLVRLMRAITKGNRQAGTFMLADTAEGYIAEVTDGVDRPLFTPGTNGDMFDRLIGRTYDTHEYSSPVLGDVGDVIFGNFQNYALAIEEDMAIASSEHAEFKKALTVFRLIAMLGGKPLHPESFAVLGDPV